MAISLLNRRQALKRIVFGGASVAAATGYARFIEPFSPSITKVEIPIPATFSYLDGFKIVQLTDFHYRPESEEELLLKIIEKTNCLNPDLVLLTGDYINYEEEVASPLIETLSHLKSKQGIMASLGNHDVWHISKSKISRLFQKKGIDLFLNRHSVISLPGNEKLAVCGLDSCWGGYPSIENACKGLKDNLPLISLVHEPDQFDQIADHGKTFLQLSGHTHGGQCRVPLLGYAPVKVKYGQKYIYGSFSKENSHLFVSRGIGTTGMQVRFSCAPEIALITLKTMV